MFFIESGGEQLNIKANEAQSSSERNAWATHKRISWASVTLDEQTHDPQQTRINDKKKAVKKNFTKAFEHNSEEGTEEEGAAEQSAEEQSAEESIEADIGPNTVMERATL